MQRSLEGRQARLTVLISGNGSNLQALIDSCNTPKLPGTTIVRVISNRKAAYGLERAAKAGIPTTYHNLVPYGKQHPSNDPSTKYGAEARRAYDADLAQLILSEEDSPDLVVMAGFMHVVTPDFLDPLARAGVPAINLHPALPGEFSGTNAIRRAFDSYQRGDIKQTGLMIHYVIKEVDMGEAVVVKNIDFRQDEPYEHFENRMHALEHVAIVEGTKIAIDQLQTKQEQRSHGSEP